MCQPIRYHENLLTISLRANAHHVTKHWQMQHKLSCVTPPLDMHTLTVSLDGASCIDENRKKVYDSIVGLQKKSSRKKERTIKSKFLQNLQYSEENSSNLKSKSDKKRRKNLAHKENDENYGGYGALDGSVSWMNMPVHGDLYTNVGEDGETGADDSMISNLPLLFANGYPTSLDKITLPELERFITFMVQCSQSANSNGQLCEPQWWPKEVPFTIPLVRPQKMTDSSIWMGNLQKLVYRCYTYHRSEYLLRFCSYISQFPTNKLEFVNNWDTTTSLFIRGSERLLVTFRNENMNYDKRIESPRKSLLPPNNAGSYGKPLKRLKQQLCPPVTIVPPSDDIYLCDNCDAELVGYEQMKAHERSCCEREQSSSRPVTPEEISLPEVKQDQFLEYFKLYTSKPLPSSNSEQTEPNSPQKRPAQRSSKRYRGTFNLTRYASIPFSSPAGMYLSKKAKTITEDVQMERLDRVERHLTAPALNGATRPKWLDRIDGYQGWVVTHKPNREKFTYIHQYNFKPYRRKPVLDLNSQLLYIAVNYREICVALTRYTENQLAILKQNPMTYTKYEKCLRRPVQLRRRPKPALRRLKRALTTSPIGDETEPIVIDDEREQNNNNPVTNNIFWGRRTVQPRLSNGRFMKNTLGSERSVGEKSSTASDVIVVDLCSSDEEQSKRENRGERILSFSPN